MPFAGLRLGFVTTWGEPAVRILAGEVENASGGSIRRSLVLATICAGVAAAVEQAADLQSRLGRGRFTGWPSSRRCHPAHARKAARLPHDEQAVPDGAGWTPPAAVRPGPEDPWCWWCPATRQGMMRTKPCSR